MNKVCFGCGIKLQSDNITADGYIPAHKHEESVYCQRCYKIIHYGKSDNHYEPKNINAIINSINKDNKYVIFLTDFLNINHEVVKIFNQIKKPKLFVVSKADLIPRDVRDITIKNFLKDYYNIQTDIKFISIFYHNRILALAHYLKRESINESYIVGLSNSGKSNLINKLIELYDAKANKLTTSNTLNTTLDFIRIKINPDLMLIDSPGFILPNIPFVSSKIKGSIKPKVYQIKAGETLKVEGMYLYFNETTSVTLYLPNEFKVTKYFKEQTFDEELSLKDNQDLIIYGLGFLNIKKSCQIKLKNLDRKFIEIRDSLFGGTDE